MDEPDWPPKYRAPHSADNTFQPVRAPTLTEELNEREKETENWQRRTLYGFTARYESYGPSSYKLGILSVLLRDLYDLDAVTSRKLRKPNLSNEILPIYKDKQWIVDFDSGVLPAATDYYRLEDHCPANSGLQGEWSMQNPIIRDIMQPVLRLATRMVTNSCLLPFLDAILLGQRNLVSKQRLPGDIADQSKYPQVKDANIDQILPRRPYCSDEIQQASKELDRVMQALIDDHNFTITFAEDSMDALTGKLGGIKDAMAYTLMFEVKSTIFMMISIKHVLPLLRQDLNDCERRQLELSLATTIVHETTHAIELVKYRELYNKRQSLEPYFDQQRNQPTSSSLPQFPGGMSMYEGVQLEEFWMSRVNAFGGKALYLGTKTQGVRVPIDLKQKAYQYKVEMRLQTPPLPEIYYSELLSKFGTEDPLKLSPKDRDALRFAKELMQQTITEDEFWANRRLMEGSFQTVLASLGTRKLSSLLNSKNDNKIGDFMMALDQSRQSHERAIHKLLETERTEGVIHIERRRNFKNWNDGMQSFTKRCRDNIVSSIWKKNPSKLATAIEAIYEGLEYCRMLLWDENLQRDKGVLSAISNTELRLLDAASKLWRNDKIHWRQASMRRFRDIRVQESCSWFADNVATSHYSMNSSRRKNSAKLKLVKECAYNILRMRNGFTSFSLDQRLRISRREEHECPEGWIGRLDEALDHVDDLRTMLEGFDPQGTFGIE
ncbi:hypothetical protein HYFRA_00006113 [Hymenoscyphus fraxineus]|uniref:Uncharacterized protein n=1 Tax=Hymenoscyphus fraxineus TaxID=746836 RepID=A0A9N9PP43_9HELO|nr:hypothetical protein HYFRA_00006113 [Hymenoscyphus fraxineus]